MRARILICACILLAATVARAVTLEVPDSLYGFSYDTVDVPVLVANQVGRNIIAVDLEIGFRDAVLLATTSYRLGAPANGWFAFVNPVPGGVRVAMASAGPLAAGDTLIVLRVIPRIADTTTIDFLRADLNEGQIPCTTDAGMYYGYGMSVEEEDEGGRMMAERRIPTLVRGALVLPGETEAMLLDAAGRLKAVLRPGDNDIRDVEPGVCFVRQGRHTAKLVVQR